jgi:mannose-1-phosphate guanylyltransferase
MDISKAILLVGGRGTRLSPLTDKTPKPMLRIAGAPVTEHQICKAKAAGIKEIVLATSYLSEVFEPHFGDGKKFDVKIHYALEESPLGTGGAIAHAASLLDLEDDESIFVFNGDVLSGHSLERQSEMHKSSAAAVTLHLVDVPDARAFGSVPTASSGKVIAFMEKSENPISNSINAGCYIFQRKVLAEIPLNLVMSVERETFPSLLSKGELLMGYHDDSYWIDMGTPESMIRASRDLILNPKISSATPTISDQILIEKGARVDPTAVIAQGSFIESGAVIGAQVKIYGSIVSSRAEVLPGSSLLDSYIGENSLVPAGSVLKNQIFGF